MFNNGLQKLNRRKIALNNLNTQLQQWKDATTDMQLASLFSRKDLARIESGYTPEGIRDDKIINCENQKVILEARLARTE
jgi:hypothetical protein